MEQKKTHMKEEIDFKDLIREPSRLFGFSYFYLIILIVGIGILYVTNLSSIGKNAAMPIVLQDSSAFLQDIPFQSPAVIPPVDVKKAGVASDQLIAKGKDIFKTNCSSCHGDNGMGDGPSGAALNPKPRNFTSLNGWTNGSKVSQIYKTLQEGIVKNGMASYRYLPAEDRFSLAHFIRTLSNGQPVDSPEELQQLETAYQLSKGSITTAQIPVKKAFQIVVRENEPVVEFIHRTAAKIFTEKQPIDQGELIYRSVASNQERSLSAIGAAAEKSKDADEFVKIVSSSPVALGLKPEILRLTDAEWNAFYRFALANRSGN
jgi:mono/diheme cytochrome c family protein